MLHVDEQPVETGRFRDHADRRAAHVMHAETEGQFAGIETRAGMVLHE
jgi:hypothetical protein